MANKLPGAIRSQIAEGARYKVDANRKHRDVTRELNSRNDGMNRLHKEDLGRGSRGNTSK